MTLAELDRERCAGLWVALYRGQPISAHADPHVLAALMAAEGLHGLVEYVKDEGRLDPTLPAVGC